jgi:hypothetical protein
MPRCPEIQDVLAAADAQPIERSTELDRRAARSTRVVTVDPADPTAARPRWSNSRVAAPDRQSGDARTTPWRSNSSTNRARLAGRRPGSEILLAGLRKATYELDTEERSCARSSPRRSSPPRRIVEADRSRRRA